MPTMTEKPTKVTWYISEDTRRALAICAAERNCSIGDLLDGLVAESLPEHLERARRAIAAGEAAPAPKKGRKPKAD